MDISRYLIINKHKYRVIVCVFACATIPKYRDEILVIRETWYKRALEKNMLVLFFLGEEETDLVGPEFIYLKGVGNDYESASLKQNLGIKYIIDNYDFDFVHVCGGDTFLVIDNMNKLLDNYDPNENLAIGGNGDYRTIFGNSMYFLNGGPGFLLSNKCCKLIYKYLATLNNYWIKMCIKYGDEYFIPASDVSISYFLQYKTNTKIIKEDDKFHYGTYSDCGCCLENPVNIVSCHSMKPIDFNEFQIILILQDMA